MNIYKRELRAHRKGFIIWCVGMCLMIAACMSKYSAGNSSGSLSEIMNSMPAVMQNMFGMGVLDPGKVLDYFAMTFVYIALIATVHASMLGATVLAKEERDKTIEFLAVKPVTRTALVTAKLCAAFTMVLILNVMTTLVSLGVISSYEGSQGAYKTLLPLMLAMFALQLIFMFIGALCSAVLKNPLKATSLSSGIMLFSFFLYIIIEMAGNIDYLNFLSPFEYFDAKDVVTEQISIIYIALAAVLITVSAILTYGKYKKRDFKI